jgi:hypothetical protein
LKDDAEYKTLKLVILENTKLYVLTTKIEKRTNLQIKIVAFPIGVSTCKTSAETNFEQATYVKNIPLLNQSPLIS